MRFLDNSPRILESLLVPLIDFFKSTRARYEGFEFDPNVNWECQYVELLWWVSPSQDSVMSWWCFFHEEMHTNATNCTL